LAELQELIAWSLPWRIRQTGLLGALCIILLAGARDGEPRAEKQDEASDAALQGQEFKGLP